MHRFQRWRTAISEARDANGVERIVRDFVDTLSPLMDAIPDECRHALTDPDRQSAAVTLLQRELAFRGSREVADLLHEIAHTFASASNRMSWLRAEMRAAAVD